MTDAKDGHAAELVNRVVASIRMLARVARVVILAGNHDWLRKGHEFFRFLDGIDGVRFVTEPWEDDDLKGEPTMFLPYTKDPAGDWKGLDLSHYRYAFMHQTVKGALASNGQRMEGENIPDILRAAGKVYSGDIHVPQQIGAVEYVGSPYHVHFGDKFKPRVLLLEKSGHPVDLHFETVSRVAIKATSIGDFKKQLRALRPGDHARVTAILPPHEAHDWLRAKRDILASMQDAGVEAHGVELKLRKPDTPLGSSLPAHASRSPAEDLERFVRGEELGGDAFDMGLDIMEEVGR